MANFVDYLTQERTFVCALDSTSKKKALEQISILLDSSIPSMHAIAIFDALQGRERLGTTGFGDGIAIPHCRLKDLERPLAALIRFEQAVDFDAMDQQPVDLFFVLLVPQDSNAEHLAILADLAQQLEQKKLAAHLRQATDAADLYQRILQA